MDNGQYLARIRQIKENFGFHFVSVAMLLGTSHPLLTWVYATGNRNNRYRRIVLESGKGVAGGVYKTGRPLVIQNADRELNAKDRAEHPITIAEDLMSMMALPLWKGEQVSGVLLMAFRTPDRITGGLFDQVMADLQGAFCDYTIPHFNFDQALGSGNGTDIEVVPVYELMNYHIIQAQEEERRRISRELHDSVVQEILGVQMLLRTVKYQADRESVMALVEQADIRLNGIQDELRSISTSLRPVALDDLGLVAAYRSHFKWVEESHGVVVRFKHNIDGIRYAPNIETVFYRICQEAVLNACKYSGCEELEVNLTDSLGYLTLEVTDQGVGFDEDALEIKGTGLGLPGMADRAELIDGELTYQSAPGRGTSIWLTAPTGRTGEA